MNEAAVDSLAAEALRALHVIESRLEASLEPLGLSLAKFGALAKLVTARSPLPLGTLAERCACVRSNITQLVDRLEAEGLVSRVPDPKDRRSVLAELTSEGRKRHAAGLRVLRQAEAELFSPLPGREQEEFLKALQALTGPR